MMSNIPASGRTGRLDARILAPATFLVVLLALWHVSTTQGWISSLILPRPWDTAVSTYELFSTGLIWKHLFATMYETLAGFLVASIFAVTLALAAGWSPLLRHMIQPYAVVLQVMPTLALAPIIITTFGFGYESKIVTAALISFFPIFVNTLTGLLIPDPQEEELFISLGAGRLKTFANVLLPGAAPMIFAGLRIGLTMALAGAVVAEFVSSEVGLGLLVQQFSFQLNLDDAFAVIIVLTLIGLGLYGLIALIDRNVVFWNRESSLNKRSKFREARYRRHLKRRTNSSDADTPSQSKPTKQTQMKETI